MYAIFSYYYILLRIKIASSLDLDIKHANKALVDKIIRLLRNHTVTRKDAFKYENTLKIKINRKGEQTYVKLSALILSFRMKTKPQKSHRPLTQSSAIELYHLLKTVLSRTLE